MRGKAAVLGLALLATLLPAGPGAAEPDRTPVRIAGTDRVQTAALLAEHGFDAAHTAVIARADDFPDALAAAALAGAVDGPVLLTARNRLSEPTRAALARLGVDEVMLLGGHAAISADVEAELAASYEVRRVSGPTRYATAAEAARVVGLGSLGQQSTVFVGNGHDFPDALAAGPAAFSGPVPLLLTAPDQLPAETASALRDLRPDRAVVLGGTAAVSDAVVNEIRALGVDTVRVAGSTRAGTATALTAFVQRERGEEPTGAVVVRGDSFADALGAGPYAGKRGQALLLSASPGLLGPDTRAWLAGRCSRSGAVQAVGGPAAVSERVLNDVLRAARVCDEGLPVRFRYSVGVEPGTGLDAGAFAGVVTGVLGDPRGWAEPGLLEFEPSSPERLHFSVVASAAPTGRDGDVLAVNADEWERASAEERTRILGDLVGHWLGVAAHIDGTWPTAAQQRAALARYVTRVRVAFAGDVHGERHIGDRLRAGDNPLAAVAPIFAGADISVVNLETAVGTSGRPADKQYTFQAPPQLVTALVAAGVDIVSLANNHALDYGVEALFETIRLAEQAGLAVVGAGRDAAEAYAPAVVEAGGRRVAVVGLSRVLSPGWAAGPGRPGIASAYDDAAAVQAVRAARQQADHVVVMIHWGVEMADCPDAHQLRLGRLLTDAGADVVAGHHPHVLQGIQQRDTGLVAYSLGNFVWYHNRAPTRYTGVLTASLPDGGHTFIPAEIDAAGSPQPAHGPLASAIHQRVAERSPGGGRCGF